MNLIEAQNRFALRLYDWSLQDFNRELESGCPLLSMVGLNDRSIMGFISWIKTLSLDERLEAASTFVRLAHEYAAELRGENGSERDKYWKRAFYEGVTIHRHKVPPLTSAIAPTFIPVNPDHCLDVLAASLNPVMGRISRSRSRIVTKKYFGDWKLETIFIFSRIHRDLRFEYQFVRKDGQPVREVGIRSFPRTLFLFYGIPGTSVEVPSHADSEPMARVMAKLAEYFIWQAEPLFEGLGIND